MPTKIQTAVATANDNKTVNPTDINVLMNSVLDGKGMRKRFDELLGKRSPQFISSLVTMVNDDANLQACFIENPMSVIKSALKAASYDLPLDFGLAYVVPFKKSYKDANGNWQKKQEATFVIGYKGLIQLCLRTGAYSRVPDATDVREGELVSYNRLTGDIEIKWIEDEEEREKLPVIGYAGYFRLKNGAEKSIYMSVKAIQNHEKKNRKGSEMGKGWREDFDSMARKTVIRKLISNFGLMSIEYQNGDAETVKLATAIAESDNIDNELGEVIEVDVTTGEVVENA